MGWLLVAKITILQTNIAEGFLNYVYFYKRSSHFDSSISTAQVW